MSYEILRSVIPSPYINQALRAINHEMWSMTPDDRDSWASTAQWFPQLEEDERIMNLAKNIPLSAPTVWAQILLQWPHSDPDNAIDPPMHLDDEIIYGHKLKWIAGVPLTPSDAFRGGVRFENETPILVPGDVVIFDQQTLHSGGVNRSPHIRYCVYFRYLERE